MAQHCRNLGVNFPSIGHLAFPDTEIGGYEVASYLLSAEALRLQGNELLVIRLSRINLKLWPLRIPSTFFPITTSVVRPNKLASFP